MMFLIVVKLDYTKKRGNSPIAHPTFEAFALPTVETDNCRKPTHDIYHPMRGQPQNTIVYIRQLTAGYNIPTVSIYRCLVF